MRLEISCADKVGIAYQILATLKKYEINLRDIEINKQGKLFLEVPTIEFSELQTLMPQLRRIDGVDDVKTTSFMPAQIMRGQTNALLASYSDPVFCVDTSGDIIDCNNALINLLEINEQSILGRAADTLVEGLGLAKLLGRKFTTPVNSNVEFLHNKYDVEYIPISIPSDDSETLAGVVVVLRSEHLAMQKKASKQIVQATDFSSFIAKSTRMQTVLKEAKRLSRLDANLLIMGEEGTGKEFMAKACHDHGANSLGEFVIFNCASIDDSLAQAELFGYVTEHGEGMHGLFAQAKSGTIIFDDISELSLNMQAKLFRAIEYGTYQRVGSNKVEYIDSRIICTSNKDLSDCVQNKTFREDLYYRLSEVCIVIPSLRERKADIPDIANLLLRQHAKKLGMPNAAISKACMEYIQSYPWPGNIRQLKNALYRAIAVADSNEITKDLIHLPAVNGNVTVIDENFEGTLEQEVKRFEKNMLKRLYPSYPSTRQLARKLGLSHTAIANKLREYGISKHSARM